MTTLSVGLGQQFLTLSAAIAASHDGDLIQVQAGIYTNDFAAVNTKITIEGLGGIASLVATAAPPNGKAILVTNTDVTLSNLAFSGTQVQSGNGAGIRYQGGNLIINNCFFADNQNGVLANAVPSGSISINNSEFSHNGKGDGLTHNLYIGEVGTLLINNSYFHDAVVGHEIKSRADNTTVQNSRIHDGPNGTASYSIDLPNGGNATIQSNVIEQGPKSQNPAIISAGEEGNVYGNSALTVTGNSIINDLASNSAVAVINDTGAIASITDNTIYNLASDHIFSPPGSATLSGNTLYPSSSEPPLVTASPWASASTGQVLIVPNNQSSPPDPGFNNGTIIATSGNHTISIAGTGNRITATGGAETVTANAGQNTINTGASNDAISIAGSGNVVDAGAGTNAIHDDKGAAATRSLCPRQRTATMTFSALS